MSVDAVAALRELGTMLTTTSADPHALRSADVDPAKVNTPGVWLRLDNMSVDTLAGDEYTLNTTAHVVIPDQEPSRAIAWLTGCFDQLRPTLESVGWTGDGLAFVGLVLPGSQTPLPALAIPLELHVTEGD